MCRRISSFGDLCCVDYLSPQHRPDHHNSVSQYPLSGASVAKRGRLERLDWSRVSVSSFFFEEGSDHAPLDRARQWRWRGTTERAARPRHVICADGLICAPTPGSPYPVVANGSIQHHALRVPIRIAIRIQIASSVARGIKTDAGNLIWRYLTVTRVTTFIIATRYTKHGLVIWSHI
jgi:hypothetical protein